MLKTIPAKTILSGYAEHNSWFGANYNMNLYKGCSHGCIYCDSRSDCYRIKNFDAVRVKENALEILERELKSKRRTGVVASGAMTDPYNPFEKQAQVTRGALSLINRYFFGASTITKSALVTRDIDLFRAISEHSPVLVKITITTPHDSLARLIEPRASLPSQRLEALSGLAQSGIKCCALMTPILPFIEDREEDIRLLVKRVYETGAKMLYGDFGVTLRMNQRDYFYEKLDKLFPGVKEKYIYRYGDSYNCASPHYNRLRKVFAEECERYGLIYRMSEIIRYYRKGYYEENQLTFFKEKP